MYLITFGLETATTDDWRIVVPDDATLAQKLYELEASGFQTNVYSVAKLSNRQIARRVNKVWRAEAVQLQEALK